VQPISGWCSQIYSSQVIGVTVKDNHGKTYNWASNEEEGMNYYDFGITAFTVLQKLKKGKGKVLIHISSRNVG